MQSAKCKVQSATRKMYMQNAHGNEKWSMKNEKWKMKKREKKTQKTIWKHYLNSYVGPSSNMTNQPRLVSGAPTYTRKV